MCRWPSASSHQDFADAIDHVVIGHDVAAGVDHHAGAHAVDAAAGVGAGSGLPGGRGDGLLAADIDHRRPHPLNRLDDRRLAQFRSRRPMCQQKAANQGRQAEPSSKGLTPVECAGRSAMGGVS